MDVTKMANNLRQNTEIIQALLHGLSEEQARWKPSPDQWSVLEVLCHLYDEERFDFRARLKKTLQNPSQPWDEIDPQGWVEQRAYNQKNFQEMIGKFTHERQISLLWLENLEAPDWENTHPHPGGDLKAGDLLVSWVMHDLLHIRQLAELRKQIAERDFAPYSSSYAGEW